MNVLLNINDIGGVIAKEDDRYVVKDNTLLKDLVVSSTNLNPMKSTTGHKHEGQEEAYFFVKGSGKMRWLIDQVLFPVCIAAMPPVRFS